MRTFLLTTIFFFSVMAQSQPIFELRDWSVYKNIPTALTHTGCVAETKTEVTDDQGLTQTFKLQVVKLLSQNGEHSMPMVLAFPEQVPSEQYYEAIGQSDREGSQMFEMTLLQPQDGSKKIVASRKADRLLILRRLKGDNKFYVDFMDKQGSLQKIEFSLSGSSKSIKALNENCQ